MGNDWVLMEISFLLSHSRTFPLLFALPPASLGARWQLHLRPAPPVPSAFQPSHSALLYLLYDPFPFLFPFDIDNFTTIHRRRHLSFVSTFDRRASHLYLATSLIKVCWNTHHLCDSPIQSFVTPRFNSPFKFQPGLETFRNPQHSRQHSLGN